MATIYVGTYTERLDHVDGHGKGIYVFSLQSGRLEPLGVASGLPNPSFLHVDAQANRLYAVSEVMSYQGKPQGAAQSFSIDPTSHQLTPLNACAIPGQAPCFVSVFKNHVLIANYMGGSVTAIRLDRNGTLGPVVSHVQHRGSGPKLARQEAAHPHAIVPLPTGNQVLVPDLGGDQVKRYRLDDRTGELIDLGEPAVVHPGAGPRHLAISPNGRYVYLMNELDSTIIVYANQNDMLRPLQTVRALPETFDGTPAGADIHVHPSGRFVYGSLRGPNSLVCLQVDVATGQLSQPHWTSTYGLTPRNFALDEAGETLIVANQDSDTLVVYQIDASSGHLEGPIDHVDVPSPACAVIKSD